MTLYQHCAVMCNVPVFIVLVNFLFIVNVINVKCTETLYISYNCTLFYFWQLLDP